MYTFDDYGRMIADHVRMDAYAHALKSAILPDSVVLDLGTGAGIHAMLACKFGARKVYAVESNDTIELASELAQDNDYADHIEFIHDLSTNITLPEQVDVIVSDLRGVLPLFGNHIPAIIDARQRHLAPGGVLIPQRDTLWVALVKARSVYRDLIGPWESPYGLTMEKAKQIALNSFSQDNTDLIRSGNLLTQPVVWSTLDYWKIDEPNAGCSLTQQIIHEGTAHGLLIWFDAELAPGIGFSNDPESEKIAEVYGRAFFPLSKPVSVLAGDTLFLDIQAELIDDTYDWHWHTCIRSGGGSQAIKAEFRQSTAT
ncbi:MAG: methyltransferase domain-containing protein [Chloroflexi bacterium]|nr:methyltransferase domain-containing protein [Chloroflexota bacterium]